MSEGKFLTGKDLQLDAKAAGESAGMAVGHAERSEESSGRSEEALVREAMERSMGNISAAAKLLGVSRPTLYAKLKKYGL